MRVPAVSDIGIDVKKIILREIEQVPKEALIEILGFIEFLKMKILHDKFETALLSESALGKAWLLPEEG